MGWVVAISHQVYQGGAAVLSRGSSWVMGVVRAGNAEPGASKEAAGTASLVAVAGCAVVGELSLGGLYRGRHFLEEVHAGRAARCTRGPHYRGEVLFGTVLACHHSQKEAKALPGPYKGAPWHSSPH